MMGGMTLSKKYPSCRTEAESRKLVPSPAYPRRDLARYAMKLNMSYYDLLGKKSSRMEGHLHQPEFAKQREPGEIGQAFQQ
jgi:hypothetical protein